MAATVKTCTGCGQVKPVDAFYRRTASPDGRTSLCKTCWKAGSKGAAALRSATSSVAPAGIPTERVESVGEVPTPVERVTRSRRVATDTGYIASKRLVALADTVREARIEGDAHPMNLLFLGPSGSGKTAAAENIALRWGVPFTKVDAASMTDPEAWFGTREIIAVNGVAVTTYRPSDFVIAITQPGVVLIDEINRIRDEHRQILLPLLDGTHRVTNPLTGEIVEKHPECYIVMSGNRGLQFTGTYPVDPALMTRALVETFDYLGADDEARVARLRTHCDAETATLFVRFANETRTRAKTDTDMNPISTREVLYACALVANGMDADDAVVVAMLNGVDDQTDDAESVRHRLQSIWTGIRPTASVSKLAARS